MIRETHWSISVVQDADVTSVSCGCEWSMVIVSSPETAGKAAVAKARAAWRDHDCDGREFVK